MTNMENPSEHIPVPQSDLDALRAKTATKMLNITARMVDSIDNLSYRLDAIDNALGQRNLDEMSPQELIAMFNQARDSFRLRQDFLKALSGYEADTSKVPVDTDVDGRDNSVSEEDAERIKAQILGKEVKHEN